MPNGYPNEKAEKCIRKHLIEKVKNDSRLYPPW